MGMGRVLLLLSFLFINGVHAQSEKSPGGFGVETNILAGKIVRHTVKFTSPIPDYSMAWDVNFVWQTYGKKTWHQRRNFPQIGLGTTYTDYGSNQVFGKAIGIYANLQIPLIRGKKIDWTVRLGDGIAYVTKKYQKKYPYDTLNVAIGTHINDFGIFMSDLRYHVNEHWHLQCGVNLTHISNGYFHTPNLGVNMVGGHIGVQYFPVTNKPKPIIKDLPKLKNRWLAQVRVGVGYTEANAKGNPELPNYVVSGYVSKRWWSKNKVYGGIDYAYHEPTYAFYKTWGIDIGHERGNAWDGTFFVGNEFLLGRVGIIAQVGYYYRKTYLKYGNDPLNEKVGGNLYIIQHEKGILKELFLTAILTTHTAVAEYAEFGLGVGF
jgi:Lipid A 3-O-deacylase (PagL)